MTTEEKRFATLIEVLQASSQQTQSSHTQSVIHAQTLRYTAIVDSVFFEVIG